MEWNPFLKLVQELKRDYIKKFGTISYEYEPDQNKTCVNRWINELGEEKYINIFTGLKLWQNKTQLSAHYAQYFYGLDENGNEIPYDDFFNAYDGLYMECRGVVIDVKREELLLTPFRKFMNLNECEETSLEKVRDRMQKAETIEFTNKLDGSMISARFCDDGLVVNGSSCNIPEKSPVLKHAIHVIQNDPKIMRMLKNHGDCTFLFEHIFPEVDPHIVAYEDVGLFLIGIRNVETGREYSFKEICEFAKAYGVKITEEYQLSLDEVLNSLNQKKSSEAEGFVLNVDGFKMKIKYDDYLAIHRAIPNFVTPNGVLAAIYNGNYDDLYAKIPDGYKDMVEKYRRDILDKCIELRNEVEHTYSTIKEMNRKDAMNYITNNVRKPLQPYVRNRYLNKEINFLKKFETAKSYTEFMELVEGK